jgi:hypothetical protein
MTHELNDRLDTQAVLSAQPLIHHLKAQPSLDRLQLAEFRVFSQFGDDGIIQYLIHHLAFQPDSFVEFGVSDYREANTRFLLINNNWKGLVLDSSPENIAHIRADHICWRHDLTAVTAFITRDNINPLLADHGFGGEIGILSIDVDGNDYWIWEAIEVANPVLVIVEYNSVFGRRHALTLPFDPAFDRAKAHHSNLYFGCSLKALFRLGQEKGYSFIGTNSHGNNAYFVRHDRLGALRAVTVDEGYVAPRIRESRHSSGALTHISAAGRLELIGDMEVLDLERGVHIRLNALAGR